MEDCQDYSLSDLEKCNYRYLQQKAQSMSLPSAVKKVYLIQLIHAKMFGTPGQVESIIEQVRSERQQLANRKRGRNKRKRLQAGNSSPRKESQKDVTSKFTLLPFIIGQGQENASVASGSDRSSNGTAERRPAAPPPKKIRNQSPILERRDCQVRNYSPQAFKFLTTHSCFDN